MNSTNHKTPHYTVFLSLQSCPASFVQLLYSVPCFQKHSVSSLRVADSHTHRKKQVKLYILIYAICRSRQTNFKNSVPLLNKPFLNIWVQVKETLLITYASTLTSPLLCSITHLKFIIQRQNCL